MTAFTPDNERRPVPRWHSAAQASRSGELCSTQSSKAQPHIESHHFDQLLKMWKVDSSIENAADLVATALVLGRSGEVRDAAEFLDRPDSDVVPLVRELAHRALGATTPEPKRGEFQLHRDELYAHIARAKLRIRAYPRNPIAWLDLARCQTVLGQRRAALRAVSVAVPLARENRFVLRSASRFFVHIGDFDQALHILRRARSLRTDPWLLSAELSISMIAKTDPAAYRYARKIVDEDALEPWHTGELYGALGTMALVDRRVGKVGRLFARSLRKPTENVIAQAQWAANRHNAVTVSEELLARPQSYEALALRARASGDWSQVIQSCMGWAMLEPTSARPLMQGAFSAGVALGDGATMLQFTERLMIGAPHSPMVLNNHAVALAYLGRMAEAKTTLDRTNPKLIDESQRVFDEATRGLIAYRSGDPEEGLRLYLQAANLPAAKKDPVLLGQLMWHLLREEAHSGRSGVDELANELWQKTRFLPLPELRGMRDSVRTILAHGHQYAGTERIDATRRQRVIAHFPDGESFDVRIP